MAVAFPGRYWREPTLAALVVSRGAAALALGGVVGRASPSGFGGAGGLFRDVRLSPDCSSCRFFSSAFPLVVGTAVLDLLVEKERACFCELDVVERGEGKEEDGGVGGRPVGLVSGSVRLRFFS